MHINFHKFLFTVSFCLFVLINAHYVYADNSSLGTSLDSLLDELSVLLDNNHSFSKNNIEKPSIQIVDLDTLCDIAYKQADNVNMKGQCSNILGLYHNKEKRIYINETVDLKTGGGKAVVLHELVHHYQFECGLAENITCLTDLEALPLFLENKYLHAMH